MIPVYLTTTLSTLSISYIRNQHVPSSLQSKTIVILISNNWKDLLSTPWDLIDLFDDEKDSLWCWEKLFKETLSAHIKTRKVKIRPNSLCWMKTDIRKALNQRYKLFLQAKCAQKDSLIWKEYRKMRNKCTNESQISLLEE